MARSASDPTPRDINQAFTALFMIFDEEYEEESGLKHAINGRIFGNLTGYQASLGEHIRWYLVALGNEVNIHTVHWHGQTILDHGRRTDVIVILPASMISVDMHPRSPGDWLFHCHVDNHTIADMSTRLHICADKDNAQ